MNVVRSVGVVVAVHVLVVVVVAGYGCCRWAPRLYSEEARGRHHDQQQLVVDDLRLIID